MLQQQSSTLRSLTGYGSALNTAHYKKEVSLHESLRLTTAVTCGYKYKCYQGSLTDTAYLFNITSFPPHIGASCLPSHVFLP